MKKSEKRQEVCSCVAHSEGSFQFLLSLNAVRDDINTLLECKHTQPNDGHSHTHILWSHLETQLKSSLTSRSSGPYYVAWEKAMVTRQMKKGKRQTG